MMERFVRSPNRMAGYFGWATTAIVVVAIFGFGAPPLVLVPIGFGSLMLYGHLQQRADARYRRRDS
jgi:hypothetical protein